MYENRAVVAIFTCFYSIAARGLERTPINGALVFTSFGLLCGPVALRLLEVNIDQEGLRMLASGTQVEGSSTSLALSLVVKEVGIGLVVGLGLTALGVFLIRMCAKHDWISDVWLQVTVVALAISCFTIVQSLHGSGYVAAFVGGMLFGSLVREHTHRLVMAGEGTAETLSLITWVAFGAAVVGQFYQYFTWQVVVYAVLSLTVIRMLPMYLALAGTGESPAAKLFLGWFGPRGLASIVFLIIVLNEKIPSSETLAVTVVCTVALSVLLHGLSANPVAKRFAASETAGAHFESATGKE